jgi:hypothetical protein
MQASAIVVSYVGFRSQEIKLSNKTSINVALEAEAVLAGEVGLIITTVKKKKKKAEPVKSRNLFHQFHQDLIPTQSLHQAY